MKKANIHLIPLSLDQTQRLTFCYNLGYRIGSDPLNIRVPTKTLKKDYGYSPEEVEEYTNGYFKAIEDNQTKNP